MPSTSFSFVDLLKASRSSPIAVLHKFLTNYDPNSTRTHAFVEGTPDLAFYRVYLEHYVAAHTLRIYNCEGKASVYETYRKIIDRFPECRRVLFFVDKDIGDITGEAWPIDPRIYVTDVYSIENYLVCREVAHRFLLDFVKTKRVEVDFGLVLAQFDEQLARFYRAVLPVMAWIVTVRRSGLRPVLTAIDLGEFLTLSDSGIVRRKQNRRLEYLSRITGVKSPPSVWKQVLRTCGELERLNPKRYVRGKFEAWFLLEFIKRLIAEMERLAKESGGSISVSTQLYQSNFAQLLVRGLPIPRGLESFLNFHFRISQSHSPVEAETGALRRALGYVRRWLSR